jgi:hypothetical protein
MPKLSGNGGVSFVVQLLTICGALVAAVLWIDSSIDEVADDVTSLKAGVQDLFNQLGDRVTVNEAGIVANRADVTDRWHGQDQLLWGERLQGRNPDLKVPDAGKIIRDRRLNRTGSPGG